MAELLMTPLGTVFLQPTFWESETKLSCQDCEQFKPNGYDGHCQKLGQSIYSKHKICQDFIEKLPPDISPSNSRRKKGMVAVIFSYILLSKRAKFMTNTIITMSFGRQAIA